MPQIHFNSQLPPTCWQQLLRQPQTPQPQSFFLKFGIFFSQIEPILPPTNNERMQCISYWKPRFPLKSHFRLDLCPKCNCCKWTSCICSKTIICSLLLLHPVSSFLVYISSQTIIYHLPISNVHRICLDRKYSQDMKRAFNQKIKAEKNSIIIFFLFLLAFQVCQQSGNKPDRRRRIR